MRSEPFERAEPGERAEASARGKSPPVGRGEAGGSGTAGSTGEPRCCRADRAGAAGRGCRMLRGGAGERRGETGDACFGRRFGTRRLRQQKAQGKLREPPARAFARRRLCRQCRLRGEEGLGAVAGARRRERRAPRAAPSRRGSARGPGSGRRSTCRSRQWRAGGGRARAATSAIQSLSPAVASFSSSRPARPSAEALLRIRARRSRASR